MAGLAKKKSTAEMLERGRKEAIWGRGVWNRENEALETKKTRSGKEFSQKILRGRLI